MQKFDEAVRQTLPFVTGFLMALMMATQTHVPRLNSWMPSLTLCVVFFWSIHRPALLGMGAAFVIGLMQDVVTGVPLGLNTLTLVLTRAVVGGQIRFFIDKPFSVHWWGFALVSLAAAVVGWLIAAIILGVWAPIGQVLGSVVLSVLVFPVVFGLCVVIDRRVLAEAT